MKLLMRKPHASPLLVCFLLTSPTTQIGCDAQDQLQYTNATDNFTIASSFNPLQGPYNANISSNWTWQLNTQSPDYRDNGNTSIRQSLSLNISPLPSPGLFNQNTVAKSQGDLKGDCTGFFSDDRRQAILVEAEFNAKYLNWMKKGDDDDSEDKEEDIIPADAKAGVCSGLEIFQFNLTTKLCKIDFAPGALIEPFPCESTNLTTSIEPIVTKLQMANREDGSWAKAHMMCRRSGKHVSNGSEEPEEVPEGPYSAAVALQ
ncbi:hypothetical protein BU23DRAFT_562985 [Bimuria novae-zelandiae CBS 107.79]|uniref:Uncharacterized protein n=1 Tax=Bimuria novae-zelandiae CBS 107.79 TaxID=1447943 RepID=A0A6A5VPF3_9PLEO|nr:hypothetical protein BU23DRAFT_562985 [Bimuria novae-zelandiae CBS 107.79]